MFQRFRPTWLPASVSIDYYVRMERGNLAGASESVLDVAQALRLDDAEREHLFALAKAAGPATRPQVLDAMSDAPAWVRLGANPYREGSNRTQTFLTSR